MLIVIVVIIVAIVAPIILSALLYVMVLGFGGTADGEITPVVQLIATPVNDGMKFTLTQPSTDVQWDDVSFVLSDSDGNSVSWFPMYTDWALQDSTRIYKGGPTFVGDVLVWFNVTDLVGLGSLYMGDFLTVTTGHPYQLSTSTMYYLALIYNPTGQALCSNTFHF
jgi:hypothetical protein